MKGSTRVNLYNQEYDKIKSAATQASVPMSKILKDYALCYLKLQEETKAFNISADSGSVDANTGIIHDLMSKMESRISSVVLDNAEEVRKNYLEIKSLHKDLQLLVAILDNFIKFYLNHTPEVPPEKRAEVLQNSMIRYERFIMAIKNSLDDGNAKIISQIQDLINLE